MQVNASAGIGTAAGGDAVPTIDEEIDDLYRNFDLERLRSVDHRLRQVPDGTMEAQEFERMYRLCVLYAHHAALPGNGLPIANKWARCARTAAALPQLRKALTVRAALRRMSGDVSGAMEDNIEAYEISLEVGDLTSSAVVLSNLANLLGRLELDRAALQLAERATEIVSTGRVPASDLAIRTRYISLSIIADRLLWSDPGRALRVSLEAERSMPAETLLVDPVHKTIFQVVRVATLCNQLVASLNMRDRGLALDIGARLRRAVESMTRITVDLRPL